jgi:predicted Ser/Thr protein kinase
MAINQTPAAALSMGTIVNDRFRVKKVLGYGGYGNVYLVEDEVVFPGNQYALKESLSSTISEQRQFAREAKWLMSLEHPNLPRVAEQFDWRGRPYFVMAYVAGENLEDRVDRMGPLPEDQVLGWMLPICDAITYLHNQKRPIIHRDIKPGNIIVSKDGRPWLVDFGIAKVLHSGGSRKTTRAARAVSGGYSPLEQYTRGGTDARSDIYALGATLYHLLTGICPPEAPDIASGVARLPDVRQVHSRVSRQTEQVVMRCMRQKPEERYQSMRELMVDLPGGKTFHITAGGTPSYTAVASMNSKRNAKGARGAPAPTLQGEATPQPAAAAPPVPAAAPPPPVPPAATIIGPPAPYAPPPAPSATWVAQQPPMLADSTLVASGSQELMPPIQAPSASKQAPARRRRVILAGLIAALCGMAVLTTMVLTGLYLTDASKVPIYILGYRDVVSQPDLRLSVLLILTPLAALLLLILPFVHWLGFLGRGWTYLLLLLLPLAGLAPLIVWIAIDPRGVINGIFGNGFFVPLLLFLITWGTSLAQVMKRR